MDYSELSKLSSDENLRLEEMFIDEEIKEAVFDFERNKSLGPDGFNLEFLKRCWEVVGFYVMKCIQEFHTTTRLPKDPSSSFIALIPKNDNPQGLNDTCQFV